ncbi:DUF4279 domain-containing protein [Pseudomonas graminis]
MNLLSRCEVDKTKVRAEFSICGDQFDLNEITERLGINPSEVRVKGVIPKGRKRPSVETSWSISTDKEDSYDVDVQTKKVLSLIKEKVGDLCEIKEKMDVSFILSLIVEVENGEKPALHFTSDTISFLGKIGAESDIDLYIYS